MCARVAQFKRSRQLAAAAGAKFPHANKQTVYETNPGELEFILNFSVITHMWDMCEMHKIFSFMFAVY